MKRLDLQAEQGIEVQIGSTIITVWDAASPKTEQQVARLIRQWLTDWLLRKKAQP